MIEPRSDVDFLKLRGGELSHSARNPRGPLQRAVMNYHRLAITRQPDVELESVGAIGYGPPESGNGVFWSYSRRASMSYDKWASSWHIGHGDSGMPKTIF